MVYRVGDVLRISCPFTPTVVTGVDEAHVSVRWPWWEIDPDAEGSRWNGEAALGRADPDELYATDPPSLRLAPGDTCRVGIPARIIHVIEVHEYDPPQESGWLPRPSLSLLVLRAGEAPDAASEFQGTSIEPRGGVPRTAEGPTCKPARRSLHACPGSPHGTAQPGLPDAAVEATCDGCSVPVFAQPRAGSTPTGATVTG